MFFVVDVETSGLTPWTGELLTIGMLAVSETGALQEEEFYIRLEHNATDPRDKNPDELTDTEKFWLDQPKEVIDEAFSSVNLTRFSVDRVKEALADYVFQVEPDKSKRFIAANPVAFDKMWLESMYKDDHDTWPFHYRCLCLRSMRYGLEMGKVEYGSAKGNHVSKIPHHGYEDAKAEALDLMDLISMKRKYHVLGYPEPMQLS